MTDTWIDLNEFLSSIGVSRIRGRMVLCDKAGNFRFRLGIQTYDTDAEVPGAPQTLTGTGTVGGRVSMGGPTLVWSWLC